MSVAVWLVETTGRGWYRTCTHTKPAACLPTRPCASLRPRAAGEHYDLGLNGTTSTKTAVAEMTLTAPGCRLRAWLKWRNGAARCRAGARCAGLGPARHSGDHEDVAWRWA